MILHVSCVAVCITDGATGDVVWKRQGGCGAAEWRVMQGKTYADRKCIVFIKDMVQCSEVG